MRICEVALARRGAGSRARTRVSVVVDWATLAGGAPGRSDADFQGPIHPDDVARLLCDSTVSRVVTGPSALPLDVGRTQRTVPSATRRALVVRDGGCRFPGCERPPGFCDGHHVVPWYRGGPTDLGNLVLLCAHHHRLVHRGDWSVNFDGHDLHVFRPG